MELPRHFVSITAQEAWGKWNCSLINYLNMIAKVLIHVHYTCHVLYKCVSHIQIFLSNSIPYLILQIRIMDCYLSEGLKIFYRVGLAILTLYKKHKGTLASAMTRTFFWMGGGGGWGLNLGLWTFQSPQSSWQAQKKKGKTNTNVQNERRKSEKRGGGGGSFLYNQTSQHSLNRSAGVIYSFCGTDKKKIVIINKLHTFLIKRISLLKSPYLLSLWKSPYVLGHLKQ